MKPSWRKLVSVLLRPSPSLIRRQDLAGNSLDDLLEPPRGVIPARSPTREFVRDIIEKLYYVGLVSDAVHKSTAQVDTGRPTSSLTETPTLLAPSVSDCVEVLLQPTFTGEGDVRQCRVVRGTTMSQGTVKRMTKELTALAPRSSGAPSRYGLEEPASWSLMFHSFALVPNGC